MSRSAHGHEGRRATMRARGRAAGLRCSGLLAGLVLALVLVSSALAEPAPPGSMRLRQAQHEGRFFVDGTGRAVYLQGAYIGEEFQDYVFGYPKRSNWSIAVSVLKDHDANFLRMWTAETTDFGDASGTMLAPHVVTPMPWQRTNVCCAADGLGKFDLSRLDVGDLAHPSINSQHYFERMRARVLDARSKGIYVSIMLFHSFGWEDSYRIPGLYIWRYHPFNAANNVNGVNPDVNGDGQGLELGTTGNSWQHYQNAYIKQVVDSVGDLDNVLYEVCNECWDTPATNAWQASVIRHIHRYEQEAGFPRHPVGMSAVTTHVGGVGDNSVLFASRADFVMPGSPDFEDNPPLADGSKVVVLDEDHIQPCSNHNSPDWPWKSFTRGNNLWYIYCGPTGDGISYGNPSDSERVVMDRMATVSTVAAHVDLRRVRPDANASTCSTTYCLIGRKEDVAYLPGGGSVTLWLPRGGHYSVAWIDTETGAVTWGEHVHGRRQTLTSPFGTHAAAVHLRRQSA